LFRKRITLLSEFSYHLEHLENQFAYSELKQKRLRKLIFSVSKHLIGSCKNEGRQF